MDVKTQKVRHVPRQEFGDQTGNTRPHQRHTALLAQGKPQRTGAGVLSHGPSIMRVSRRSVKETLIRKRCPARLARGTEKAGSTHPPAKLVSASRPLDKNGAVDYVLLYDTMSSYPGAR